ncbi:MAG: hypothetical protein IKV14_08450 [Muribaculaceae bacterium]|nr:hypothetical protein [Muribaculaceae bacterium]
MKLHLFNPENDLAIADGNANYCPPPSALKIAYDLSTLPLWYADKEDVVYLPNISHSQYYNELSQKFSLPNRYSVENSDTITKCIPWGWSMYIRKKFENMGLSTKALISVETINRLRELSNRKVTIEILTRLNNLGVDIPSMPRYITNLDEVGEFICSMPRSVIKAPWSGSGKGIAWGLGRMEIPVEHFYKGVIRRQGGVVCEKFLNKAVDFAMEFYYKNGTITFAGYSLFKSVKGVYSGNILATDAAIEEFLNSYMPQTPVTKVKENIITVLEDIFKGFDYEGYFGVDMMIYSDENNHNHINPCVELNLRTNMGIASRILYDKHIDNNCVGVYNVTFYKQNGEALKTDNELKQKYPPTICNGKLYNGYISLSPINKDTKYSAYVIVNRTENQNSLSSLYNR